MSSRGKRNNHKYWEKVLALIVLLGFILPLFSIELKAQSKQLFTESLSAKGDSCRHFYFPVQDIFYPSLKEIKTPVLLAKREGIPIHLKSKDNNFYYLSILLLFTGVTFSLYPKYITDLLRSFFRPGFLSRSLSDQLFQNSQAAFLLNFIFFLVFGTFIYLVLQFFGVSPADSDNQYLNIPLCVLGVSLLYGAKSMLLTLSGWLLADSGLLKSYSRIVFLMNKFLGIMLLPVLALLMLGDIVLNPFLMTLSLCFVGFMFIIRYLLAWFQIGNQVNISSFHFFIYICTFEFLPLMIIGKFLMGFLGNGV